MTPVMIIVRISGSWSFTRFCRLLRRCRLWCWQMAASIVFLLSVTTDHLQAQSLPGPKQLFQQEEALSVEITTDFRKVKSGKVKKDFAEHSYPALVAFTTKDSVFIRDSINLRTRGKLRREICDMPPLKLNFNPSKDSVLGRWGTLKLVCACGKSDGDEQLLLREYLVYKMLNLITEKSFRVRLLNITYNHQENPQKSYSQYAFLLEDTDDMAKRNGCNEVEGEVYPTPATHRWQATLVCLFQYMVGNTDFEVQKYHNIKLMRETADSTAPPMVVPYDFDNAGVVNARYAVPDPAFGITQVTERFYRGLPRAPREIEAALDIFHKARPAIDSLVMNFAPLSAASRKHVSEYIAGFYDIIANPQSVKSIFLKQ